MTVVHIGNAHGCARAVCVPGTTRLPCTRELPLCLFSCPDDGDDGRKLRRGKGSGERQAVSQVVLRGVVSCTESGEKGEVVWACEHACECASSTTPLPLPRGLSVVRSPSLRTLSRGVTDRGHVHSHTSPPSLSNRKHTGCCMVALIFGYA